MGSTQRGHTREVFQQPASGLNTAVYDSMMVGIAKNPLASAEKIQAMKSSLLADVDYRKQVRDATTDVDVVKKRMEAVLKALA